MTLYLRRARILAGVRPSQALRALQRRGLASSIGTEDAKDLSFGYFKKETSSTATVESYVFLRSSTSTNVFIPPYPSLPQAILP